jgi:hypothetical protein
MGPISITGTFLGKGVECPQFRLENGEQISLSGTIPEHQVGDEATLTGRWSMISTCMQGREFRVSKARE